MKTLYESPLFETLNHSNLPALVLDGFLKGLILLALIGLAVLALRKASASARHSLWLAGLLGVLALPLLVMNLPGWKVIPETWLPAGDLPEIEIASLEASVSPAEFSTATAPESLFPAAAPLESLGSPIPGPEPEFAATPIESRLVDVGGLSLLHWVSLIWLVGAGLLGARLLLSRLGVIQLTRQARRVTGGFLEEELRELCGQLKIRRTVVLLLSHQRAIPMTWGIFRPRVLLPSEAATWKAEKRRAVLLHELGHVARRDCLSHLVGQIALAIHWFNPLVWVAVWRLSVEQEHACDDLVVGNGVDPPDYAELILNLSSAFPVPRMCGSAATAMAKPAGLEKRLRGILNPSRNRRSPGWGAVLAGAAGLTLILCPLAMIRAENENGPSIKEETVPPGFIELTADSLSINGTRVEADGNRIIIFSDVSKSVQDSSAARPDETGHVIFPNPENDEPYRIRMADKDGQAIFLSVNDAGEEEGVLVRGVEGTEQKLLVRDRSRSDSLKLMIGQLEKLRSQLAPQVREQPLELMLDFATANESEPEEMLDLMVQTGDLDHLYREIAEELDRISKRLNQALEQRNNSGALPGIEPVDAVIDADPTSRNRTQATEKRSVTYRNLDSENSGTANDQQRIFTPLTMTQSEPYTPRKTGTGRVSAVPSWEAAVPSENAFTPATSLRDYAAMAQPAPPADLYKLSLPVSGIVREAPVKPGTRVKKGQVLLQLDDRSAGNELAIAKQQLDVARATIELKEVEIEGATSKYEEVKALFAKGAVTSSETNAIQREMAAARVSLKVAEAEVAVTASHLSQAEIAVEQHRIVAPVDGVVVSVQHKKGEFANAGVPAVILREMPVKKSGSVAPASSRTVRSNSGIGGGFDYEAGGFGNDDYGGTTGFGAGLDGGGSKTPGGEVEIPNIEIPVDPVEKTGVTFELPAGNPGSIPGEEKSLRNR